MEKKASTTKQKKSRRGAGDTINLSTLSLEVKT